ncbi:asparagine synthetase domain-containing protein CG17486 isoform X2 [Leptidea sinapis]|uniref:asparagine synthetase domain-containing protein CG17486 isoform X2 n=1 Tax=Leptidea sinapis TaxID=189913 RepID=UPI002144EE79|nr:asparagine synthetase domain-containing protein CG17486 isoform X2 [Leptidea sinapis]
MFGCRKDYQCVEIPATYIYVFNVKENIITTFDWDEQVQNDYLIDEWLQNVEIEQNLSDSSRNINKNTENVYFDEQDEVIKYIEHISDTELCKLSILEKLLEHEEILYCVKNITKLLEDSVKVRLETQPERCIDCISINNICCHSAVGILFSGGLDCTILAYLANKYVKEDQSIDLINVAFKKKCDVTFDVPDRLTGKQSYEELKQICNQRKWIFREINVLKEDLVKYQSSRIADLIYPRKTVLDESLGCALWYAAQGQDECNVSACRILLLGSGADELFGGYVRHRNAYKRRGWPGLNGELMLDWDRISFRNLARDNRVICDHGRVPRLPYLDDDFTEYVLKLKPWFKCFPSDKLGTGIGDKLMLRLVAFHLGLKNAVTLPKRALQFGSRIANKKQNGSDLSQILQIN